MSPSYSSPWPPGWREAAWSSLPRTWDIIVIGGGVTGAGILALAARMGLRVLLLEQGDFASGTSSRSSKLVHGGLRYLKHMQIKLTRESVQERQYLLHTAPGLVTGMNFVYPVYEGDSPGAWMIELGLGVYTRMSGGAGGYRELQAVDLLMLAPGLRQRGLESAYLYGDAQTDDARLVLRVLHDALLAGQGQAAALNYARVVGLARANGRVAGVQVRDLLTGAEAEATAPVVINATGAWADHLRGMVGAGSRLRPLRGSHLFFPRDRFPIYQAIAMLHPDDGRPVFAYPWEGVILLGTTDVDHETDLDAEPGIALAEADYLLRAAQSYFPDWGLTPADVISTQAGVRPVVDTGKTDPSAETREHVAWAEQGLLTVTGGKLTTFRLIALDALAAAREMNPDLPKPNDHLPVLEVVDAAQPLPDLDPRLARRLAPRLWGRYGAAAPALVAHSPDLLTPIPGAPYLWAELAWSAQHEAVAHLDDLLLRRFRLGILLADGGQSLIHRLGALSDWDETRWLSESERYRQIWRQAHGRPAGWEAR